MQQHIFKDTIKANVGKKSYFESEQDVMITAPLGWKKKNKGLLFPLPYGILQF